MQDYQQAEQNLNTIGAAAITLVVAGMVLAFGSQITDSVADEVATCPTTSWTEYNATTNSCYDPNFSYNETPPISQDFNATQSSMSGLSNLAGKLPSVGLIIGAVVIIGLLIAGFAGLR